MLNNKSLKLEGAYPLLVLASLLLGGSAMYAADLSAGTSALSGTTGGVARYVPVVQKVAYALAAVIAVVSAVIIYKKLQDGSENARKLIVVPVLACVFLTASATALPAFFGLDVSQDDAGWNAGGGGLGGSTTVGGVGDDSSTGTDGPANNVNPAQSGSELGPDGSLQYYIYDDDGNKYVSNNWFNTSSILSSRKFGYNEYGEAAIYFEIDGKKIWSNMPVLPEYNGLLGKRPDGRYGFYHTADDGTKIWDEFDTFQSRRGYTDNRNVCIGRNAAGAYEAYYTLEDGTKVWTGATENNIYVGAESAHGIAKDPKDGSYKFYCNTDDGGKIYGSNYSALYYQPFAKLGVDESGKTRFYVVADDGVKIWGEEAAALGLIQVPN